MNDRCMDMSACLLASEFFFVVVNVCRNWNRPRTRFTPIYKKERKKEKRRGNEILINPCVV